MTRVVQFMRDLVATGMSWDDAAAFAERFEEGLDASAVVAAVTPALASKRARDAARMRAIREAEAASKPAKIGDVVSTSLATVVGDVVDDSRGDKDAPAPVHTRGEDTSLRLVDTRTKVGVGGVDARKPDQQPDAWPTGDAVTLAKLLVRTVASPWLDPNKSPDLVTTTGRIAAWKRDGASWEHDVLPVVTGLCANRRSAISSWKFFDNAMGRSIADNRAALAIPEASERRPSTGPPRLSFAEQAGADKAASIALALKGLTANG